MTITLFCLVCFALQAQAQTFSCEKVGLDRGSNPLLTLYTDTEASSEYEKMFVNNIVDAFSCGDLLIVTTQPRKYVFGAALTFVFEKKSGKFLGSVVK